MSYRILSGIHSPEDVEKLNNSETDLLCAEIREELIKTVSHNGGHLSPNLGVVELTVAMHQSFHSPMDQFVWDVGHQAYTHKLLTGRFERFSTLRTEGGISGFTRPSESEHDIFSSGHSSVSISQAFGLARAKALKQEKGYVVAVIGDGALTGGLAYEALNNAARSHDKLIVILNDNAMSISKNVGAMARYLAVVRSSPSYFKLKTKLEHVLQKIPLIGHPITKLIFKTKGILKGVMYHSTFFEDMGFTYMGPFDGHNVPILKEAFAAAKKSSRSVLMHVNTIKGKGYDFAEKNPTQFHGISKFDIQTGEPISSGKTFSSVFGNAICEFARSDSRICAITAAMRSGTGLEEFSKEFAPRFFDVGIAEPHAITFASGLARGGMLPVFAVYSTFLQRCYDQLVHDGAMQGRKIVLAIDRAGFVGEDGESHQGVYDAAFLNSIPDAIVYSPATYEGLRSAVFKAFYKDNASVVAIRYPRGTEKALPDRFRVTDEDFTMYEPEASDTTIVTYGRLFGEACDALKRLKEAGIPVRILKLNKIKPIHRDAVAAVADSERIFFFEEGIRSGGVGEHMAALLLEYGYSGQFQHIAVNDCLIAQASVTNQLRQYHLDAESMEKRILGSLNIEQ